VLSFGVLSRSGNLYYLEQILDQSSEPVLKSKLSVEWIPSKISNKKKFWDHIEEER
jgi:hypothetical protein